MLCAYIDSSGFIKEAIPLPDGTCANYVLISKTEFALIDAAQITSEQILIDFSFGFGAVVFFWFLGFVIGATRKTVQLL